jgi:hypothetical protein
MLTSKNKIYACANQEGHRMEHVVQCALLKRIYGRTRASREWYKLFHQTVSSLGLKRATCDTSLYTMNHPVHGFHIVLVCVDDILIVSDSHKWIESAKRAIRD